MARACGAAIQNVLHGQVHVDTLGFSGDFNAISEGRDCAVGPAAAAILGNVLVEALGHVAHAIFVRPAKGLGQVFRLDVIFGERRYDDFSLVSMLRMPRILLSARPDLALVARRGRGLTAVGRGDQEKGEHRHLYSGGGVVEGVEGWGLSLMRSSPGHPRSHTAHSMQQQAGQQHSQQSHSTQNEQSEATVLVVLPLVTT
eukprot:SAG25_NODE_187_length_12399_cov_42.588537_1_plen_200_part_00